MPKEQVRSEKAKLKHLKARVYLKSGQLDDCQSLLFSKDWKEAYLSLHQSVLTYDANLPIAISNSFLIISRNQPFFELVYTFTENETNILHIIRFDSMKNFLEITAAILLSKRPSWIMSPICQLCSNAFRLFSRPHHCRNCGKSICKSCSKLTSLEILGYMDNQRVCMQCIDRIENCINFICNLRKKEMNSSVVSNLYDLPYNQSVLVSSLMGN